MPEDVSEWWPQEVAWWAQKSYRKIWEHVGAWEPQRVHDGGSSESRCDVLPEREFTAAMGLVGAVPEGKGQDSEDCAVSQAHQVPLHQRLLTVQKNWITASSALPSKPHATSSSRDLYLRTVTGRTMGYNFSPHPSSRHNSVEPSGHQLSSSCHKVSLFNSMHPVQCPAKIKGNEQRPNYDHDHMWLSSSKIFQWLLTSSNKCGRHVFQLRKLKGRVNIESNDLGICSSGQEKKFQQYKC